MKFQQCCVLLVLVCPPAWGCASDDDTRADAGSGGSGAGMTSASGGNGGSGGSGGSAEVTCLSNDECASGEFCNFGDDLCGAEEEGRCVEIPAPDPTLTAPVCGCDGNIYEQGAISTAGVDAAASGGCTPPSGTFDCGAHFCAVDVQHCYHFVMCRDFYTCEDFDSGCAAQDCSCFNGLICNEDMDGNVRTYNDAPCNDNL